MCRVSLPLLFDHCLDLLDLHLLVLGRDTFLELVNQMLAQNLVLVIGFLGFDHYVHLCILSCLIRSVPMLHGNWDLLIAEALRGAGRIYLSD